MKVLVVGGAGDMGSTACRKVAEDPQITSVIVADRDHERARALAEDIGEKASARGLDILDRAALVAALGDVDIVLNTVGPFYLYGPPVLEAAIETGKHYVDIADDWEPTIDMLQLDGRASEAGLVAIVGMGASPGVSNLLGAILHRHLDSVDTLHTVWRGGTGVPKAPERPEDLKPAAAIDHWIHNLAEPIRVWRDGGYQEAEALETFEIVYPGIGPGQVWTCGHPEPITLPRTFGRIQNSYNLMFARPGLIAALKAVCARVRKGELDVSSASRELLMSSHRRGPEAGPVPAFPGVFAYAEGTKEGARVRAAARAAALPDGGMGESTCIPLAIVAGMIARGEVGRRGVLPPEAAVDPDIFFSRLATYTGSPTGVPPVDISTEPY